MKPNISAVARFLVAVLAALWLSGVGPRASMAAAATFTLDPTQIHLSGRTTSVLLKLRNESNDTLRFQLSVFAWSQSASGEMQLEPTQDIVFFPSLLVLQPAEERRVRVGMATTFEAREKTYRIFVEELPPVDAGPHSTGAIRVLTKMGIPIFLRPSKPIASAALRDLRQRDGRLQFTLANSGTVHFVPQRVTVRALAGASTAFERKLDGWYILAGGVRDFEVRLPTDNCASVTSIVVQAAVGSENVEQRLVTPSGACGP